MYSLIIRIVYRNICTCVALAGRQKTYIYIYHHLSLMFSLPSTFQALQARASGGWWVTPVASTCTAAAGGLRVGRAAPLRGPRGVAVARRES